MKTPNRFFPARRRGFTIVEIMIVVVIIGLLASLAAQSFIQSRRKTIAVRVANDLRVFAGAFEQYVFEEGAWPADVQPGQTPAGMADYLMLNRWTNPTPAGGNYDWDNEVFGVTAAVSVADPNVPADTLAEIDRILDDGNTSTGRVRLRADGIMFILEP